MRARMGSTKVFDVERGVESSRYFFNSVNCLSYMVIRHIKTRVCGFAPVCIIHRLNRTKEITLTFLKPHLYESCTGANLPFTLLTATSLLPCSTIT